VYQGFAVVERGPQHVDKATYFNLEDHIIRRPAHRRTELIPATCKKAEVQMKCSVENGHFLLETPKEGGSYESPWKN
jgi:hypothetical protein